METVLIFLPYFISLIIGFLALDLIFLKKNLEPLFFKIILALLLGLGISSTLTFLSFIFLNRFHPMFIIIFHGSVIGILLIAKFKLTKNTGQGLFQIKKPELSDYGAIALFAVLLIPAWIQASFYPNGGWDAWSTWNLKAKFLLLSGEDWKNMFDPILWRSSPQYPLLLPLINVWGWTFINKAVTKVPTLTTLIFTFCSCGLLYSALKRFTHLLFAIIPVILLLTATLFVKLATSQYVDVVVGCYLLATILCLILAKKNDNYSYAILAGLLAGFLSFTKSEGLISCILIFLLSIPFFLLKNASQNKKKDLLIFLITSTVAMIPTFLFMIFLAPDNTTFINGLTSTTHPSTFERFRFIFAFYFFEMKAPKWGGIWIILLIGFLFSLKRCLNKETFIIPLFLLMYVGMITFYYFLNTNFAIGWWLQVTLHRLIFAVLPLTTFWVFYSVGQKD